MFGPDGGGLWKMALEQNLLGWVLSPWRWGGSACGASSQAASLPSGVRSSGLTCRSGSVQFPPPPSQARQSRFFLSRFPLCAATRSARFGSVVLVVSGPAAAPAASRIHFICGACPRPDPLTSVQNRGGLVLITRVSDPAESLPPPQLPFLVSEGKPEKDGAVRGAEAEVTSERERDSNAHSRSHAGDLLEIFTGIKAETKPLIAPTLLIHIYIKSRKQDTLTEVIPIYPNK